MGVRDGTAGFDALSRPHFDALDRTALRLSPHPSAAEDLVQEACLRAHRDFAAGRAGLNTPPRAPGNLKEIRMPDRYTRRVAIATIAAGTFTASPALAWHDTVHRSPSTGGSRSRSRESGPQAEAQFGDVPLREDDFVLGASDAPITLIKYGSLACPHCAAFHEHTAAALKRGHIPDGRVRYVHRHFPLDQLAMAAAVLLHCGDSDRDRFYALLDILYAEQSNWTRASDPIDALRRIAASTGLNGDQFAACRADRPLAERILAERSEGAEVFGVQATPTLLINGARYSGNLGLAQIDRIFDQIA